MRIEESPFDVEHSQVPRCLVVIERTATQNDVFAVKTAINDGEKGHDKQFALSLETGVTAYVYFKAHS